MKNLKFENIDLFKASIIESDKIMGGYDGGGGSTTPPPTLVHYTGPVMYTAPGTTWEVALGSGSSNDQ